VSGSVDAAPQSAFEVIVIGGDPEGVAAAVAAARAGARTLLVDPSDRLGGLWTRGWLNVLDMNLDAAGKPLNGGIFAEIYRRLDGTSFDVAAMERHLRQLVAATPNLVVATAAVSVRPVLAGRPRPLFKPGQTLWPDDPIGAGSITPGKAPSTTSSSLSRGLESSQNASGSSDEAIEAKAVPNGLTSEAVKFDPGEKKEPSLARRGQAWPTTVSRSGEDVRSLLVCGSEGWLADEPPFLPDAATEAAVIEGIELLGSDGRCSTITGQRFIDASQDADLAVAAGAGWIRYGEDVWGEPRNMAVTLVFRLDGIGAAGWSRLRAELRARGGGTGLVGANDRSAWGFGETLREYKPRSPRVGVRALNIGRQDDDTVLINALQVFGVDGLDPVARREARQIAEAELPSLVAFLRRRLPGFETARLAGTAPELYVRTSRQIKALHRLTVDDVLENRDFPDRVAFGSYPLDVQATDPGFAGDIIGKPACYAVPLRSLIPRGFANLLVVGRSAGFDSLAQSSARTVPVGIAAGQGAGVAAVVSLRRQLPLDRLPDDPGAVGEMHRQLAGQGVTIGSNPARPGPETTHWAYAGLRFLRRRAQISGGYHNRYDLDAPMPVKALTNRLLFLGRDFDQATRQRFETLGNATPTAPLTLGAACLLLHSLGMTSGTSSTDFDAAVPAEGAAAAIAAFRAAGLLAPPWPSDLKDPDQVLSRGAGYLLLTRWWLRREGHRPSP
jgi:hypothetical protein